MSLLALFTRTLHNTQKCCGSVASNIHHFITISTRQDYVEELMLGGGGGGGGEFRDKSPVDTNNKTRLGRD